jgi:hypothetical protein
MAQLDVEAEEKRQTGNRLWQGHNPVLNKNR